MSRRVGNRVAAESRSAVRGGAAGAVVVLTLLAGCSSGHRPTNGPGGASPTIAFGAAGGGSAGPTAPTGRSAGSPGLRLSPPGPVAFQDFAVRCGEDEEGLHLLASGSVGAGLSELANAASQPGAAGPATYTDPVWEAQLSSLRAALGAGDRARIRSAGQTVLGTCQANGWSNGGPPPP